jgi:hypothetical protein
MSYPKTDNDVGYIAPGIKVEKSCKIKINGKEIQTYLVNNVQRLPENRIIRYLFDVAGDGFDFNKMSLMVSRGMFSVEEIQQIYQYIGYSVCGYGEIFEDEIINPMWDDKE